MGAALRRGRGCGFQNENDHLDLLVLKCLGQLKNQLTADELLDTACHCTACHFHDESPFSFKP